MRFDPQKGKFVDDKGDGKRASSDDSKLGSEPPVPSRDTEPSESSAGAIRREGFIAMLVGALMMTVFGLMVWYVNNRWDDMPGWIEWPLGILGVVLCFGGLRLVWHGLLMLLTGEDSD